MFTMTCVHIATPVFVFEPRSQELIVLASRPVIQKSVGKPGSKARF